jgi:hypothetical protein
MEEDGNASEGIDVEVHKPRQTSIAARDCPVSKAQDDDTL